MDCSKRSAPAVGGLPDDPLVEILSRVPAKSLCRFKCVSKAWRDLIDDPHNRKKLPQAMQGIFYSYTTSEKVYELAGSEVNYFSFVDLRTARSVPLFVDPCFSFLMELPGIQFLDLLDSCNGLVLFANRQHRHAETLGYIVCNPTTKQWQDVPTRDHPPPPLISIYLAFDPVVSPHFSLVQFEVDRDKEEFMSVHAYSSETGTWSRSQIDQHGEQGQSEGWHYHQVIEPSFDILRSARWAFVNGILHMLVWDWGEHQQLILAVDAQGKAWRTITVPGATKYVSYVGQSQGLLHCITRETLDVDDGSYELSIWVLQEYDTQEWVLKDTLTSLQLFAGKSYEIDLVEVVDIHQDRNVVFIALSLNTKLIAYDMDRKEVSVVSDFKPKYTYGFARYVPYFSESRALTNKQ